MDRTKGEARLSAKFRFWGPASSFGLLAALLAFVFDQAHKYWMLDVYRIGERGRVEITPFFDLVMAWNKGVSYGLFPQQGSAGRFVLIAVSLIAVASLLMWMANSMTRFAALSLGLIIGGALGNLTDRLIYGAVADFFHFHYGDFSWYIFNIADVAITVGVIGLILDWIWQPREQHTS